MKEVKVISLGGSVILKEKFDVDLLKKFIKVIINNSKKYKYVIVCGGGNIARIYMDAIEKEAFKNKKYEQSDMGIAITRLNAHVLNLLFDKKVNKSYPTNMIEIERLLKRHDIVVCGGLRHDNDETSDSTCVKIARHFKAEFINITNVNGLYDKDPKSHKDAKFIHEITKNDFLKIAKKIEYKPGMHFVIDPKAAKIIKKYNIKSYIIGEDMINLNNLLAGKHFFGTIII